MTSPPKTRWTLEFSAPSYGEAKTFIWERGVMAGEYDTICDAERPGFYRVSSTDEGWLTRLRDELAENGHTTTLAPEV